jgi:hypothetical protein
MKLLVITLVTFLTACSSLMNSSNALQPVVVKDANQKIMFTTCGGVVEDWGSCNRKAAKTCANGYAVLEKEERLVGVPVRELTFQCK